MEFEKITYYFTTVSFFFLGFIFFPIQSGWAQDALKKVYTIHADFRHADKRQFLIEMDAAITNVSSTDIDELIWMMYPNRFLKPLPNLDDLNYRRVYTNGFSEGFLRIDSLSSEEKDLNGHLETLVMPPIPDHTLFSLKLDKPLKPNETKIFHFKMTLQVPKKYGSFGYYRDRLTMSGGWTPFIVSRRDDKFYPFDQSPKADWNVHILADEPYVVGSELYKPMGVENIIVKKDLGQFSIQIGRKIKQQDFKKDEVNLTITYDTRNPEKILNPIKDIFDPWSQYVENLDLPNSAVNKNLSFVQAPLREMLGVDAQEVSFFSDRAYKTIQGLYSFHNVPLIRMMFAQYLFPHTIKKENSRDYFWINELVSWQLTEDFLQTQHYKHRDARNMGVIKMFSILPLIDQLIHQPQFAFFDVFYNFVYPYDPVRDEFTKFNHRRQFGKSVLAHMIDELGEEKVQEIVHDYIQSPDKTFLQVAEKDTNLQLTDRFDHWTSQRPILNYRIKKHKSKKTIDGYENMVVIEKESVKSIQEPVEIKVIDREDHEQTFIWDSTDTEETLNFKTKAKIRSIEIDPNGRLLETKLSDNRAPPYWKFVLTELFLQYDFNANQPQIVIESQIRKKYGGQDRYNIGGFYQADSYGVNFGYTRLFGRIIDSLRLSHGVGLSYSISRLNTDGVVADADPPQLVDVTNSGYVTSLTASYFFGNELSFTNPLQGGYGGVSTTYGTSKLGGDFNFYQVLLNGAWILQLHPSHLLAFRGVFGTSGNDSIPSQIQFRLGGLTSMKGLSVNDEKYIGRNILLTSAEYRHFLFQDCDVNLGLFRIRDIQGALIVDAGRVTDTVQQKADQSIPGNSVETTDFRDLFEPQHFATDVGYGVRFFVDYLGVSPGLMGLDMAQSLSDRHQGVRFYFTVTQSF